MTNFIGVYDNVLSNIECNKIIDYFENNPNKKPGNVGDNRNQYSINTDIKDSMDLRVFFSEENEVTKLIYYYLVNCCKKYRLQYPDLEDSLCNWGLKNGFNIQRYFPGQGFKAKHCEHVSKDDTNILAWMIYLNSVEDGGTKFTSFDLVTECLEGRVVIWPAYWTHSHHGIVSNTKTKYIATGWYCFN